MGVCTVTYDYIGEEYIDRCMGMVLYADSHYEAMELRTMLLADGKHQNVQIDFIDNEQ